MFGPRATGKSSLLKSIFQIPDDIKGDFLNRPDVLWINLLNAEIYQQLVARPQLLKEWVDAKKGKLQWVICDEVQKIPALLDVVHDIIEESKIKFGLTGSSARKLKKTGVNLLAGRALVNELFPLTHRELGNDFELTKVLQWGSLPEVFTADSELLKSEILRAYVGTYLREEIKEEQFIRNLNPFVRFLEVSSQQNGEITNAARIGRDSNTDSKTILRYFEILVDTLMGIFLDPFQKSVRKVQTEKSKFYWFDLGVRRALEGTLSNQLIPGSSEYGKAFEHFFITEAIRLAKYSRKEDRFAYLRTKDDVEIDFIVERSRKHLWAIEIKSSRNVDVARLGSTLQLAEDLGAKKLIVASLEDRPRKVGKIEIIPWQQLLDEMY